LDIPVSQGKVGLVLSAGLNVAAALEENKISSDSRALADLRAFSTLVPLDIKAEAVTFLRQNAAANPY
jgi:repressor of nif and glnA expression